MWKTICSFLLVATALGALACADGTSPRALKNDLELVLPGLDRMRPSFFSEEPNAGADSPPSEQLPPEFQQAPSIIDYRTDAGFGSANAWAEGFMRYFASHARQDVNLVLRFNGSALPPVPAKGANSDFWPADRTLSTSANVVLEKPCGWASYAWTNHSAWHQFPLVGQWLRWGDTDRSSNDGASAPPCETDTGDGGGGGGGGTVVQVCYCMDYYSPTSGQWVHGGIIYCLEA